MTHLRTRWFAVLFALVVVGCTQPGHEAIRETPPEAALAPVTALRSAYAALAAQGHPVYRVDAAQSLVAITVRRGGSLARLGHDHVVASHSVQGWIAPDANRADLYVPLSQLTVDEPALRAEAGLDTQPSASDIAGTRSNMLDKVLETQKFPYALIHIASVDRNATGGNLNILITLRDVTRPFVVPATLQAGPGTMDVDGVFDFKQSVFGIVPFSILGGAVKVEDTLRLRFMIQARRAVAHGLPTK